MKVQPLITQKVAELYLEVRSGIPHNRLNNGTSRVDKYEFSHAADSVAGTTRANRVAGDTDPVKQLKKVKQLQEEMIRRGHRMKERTAEDIARQILETIV